MARSSDGGSPRGAPSLLCRRTRSQIPIDPAQSSESPAFHSLYKTVTTKTPKHRERDIYTHEKRRNAAYIGVELSDEAGEVVVLEVLGEKMLRELGRVPNHEAVVASAPRDDRVRRRVVHHVVCLAQERRWGARGARDRISSSVHFTVGSRSDGRHRSYIESELRRVDEL